MSSTGMESLSGGLRKAASSLPVMCCQRSRAGRAAVQLGGFPFPHELQLCQKKLEWVQSGEAQQ